MLRLGPLLLTLGFVLVGCRAEVTEDTSTPPVEASPEVVVGALGDTVNVHVVGDVITAGQPDLEALRTARDEHGVKTVINLRRAEEMGDFDEKAAATELGLDYVHVPFGGAESLTDEVFASLRARLGDPEARPVLLHCKSANRVGAIWYAYRVLDEGASEEAAMAEALAIGLRKEGHIERAKAYVGANRGSDG